MQIKYLYYQVRPHDPLPDGMRPLTLTVLSPVWQGPGIHIIYPDGWRQTLMGLTASGARDDLRIFWTQGPEAGPTVCLAIGGDGGVLLVDGTVMKLHDLPPGPARPFQTLAESVIPADVAAFIGPAPPRTPLLLG